MNCSGIGARKLVGDNLVSPLRGQVGKPLLLDQTVIQVMRVSAPWLRKVVLDDRDDGNYVIPNLESVVVGGTHQDGDWDRVSLGLNLYILLF